MNHRILSVDDHTDTVSLLQAMLAEHGYEVVGASSVAEGLRLARSQKFDLYLLDYLFAEGTGRELCERIREFDRDTPILFFSGSHPDVHREVLSRGAQGLVMKPDFKALRREIWRVLGRAA